VFKRFCTVAAASCLLSCTIPKPQSNGPSVATPVPIQPGAGTPAAGGLTPSAPAPGWPAPGWPAPGTYRIDSSGSELRLLVYRAGALASLGHNHVILNRSVTGSIEVATTLGASSFSVRAPVAAFIVDDAQARTEEGEDFPGEISDEAKTGTWNNMTGSAVLNSNQYPVISVRSTRLEQSQGTLTAMVTVSVAGHESTQSVPFVLSREAYGLSASASFELRQSALGLTPFSLLLGALAVRDAMQVKLKVAAQLEAPR
jgi:hypothetical protein